MTKTFDDWQEIAGNSVLVPPTQKGIIHFLGGAFIGAAPQVTYKFLLESIAAQGYIIVATPFINTLDHGEIAKATLNSFEQVVDRLKYTGEIHQRYLPIYGLGHSMGCKLHLLIGSLFQVERAGNILMAYNNFPIKRSVPLLAEVSQQFSEQIDQLRQVVTLDSVEFTPSPSETLELIATDYPIRRNLLVKFRRDDLDQTRDLQQILTEKFGAMVSLQRLNGTHITPLGQVVNWQVKTNFSPLDAIGQWVKQNVFQDLEQLSSEIRRWLDPTLI